MSGKEYSGFFLFCLDLELFIKCKKRVGRNQVFTIFAKTQDLNKIKNPTHPGVDISK